MSFDFGTFATKPSYYIIKVIGLEDRENTNKGGATARHCRKRKSSAAANSKGDGCGAVPFAFTAFVALLLLDDFEAGAVDDLAQFRFGHFLIVVGDDGFALLGTDHRSLHAVGGLESLGDGIGALVAL
jgi:hypothetical protein